MKIINNKKDNTLNIGLETKHQDNLGWEMGFEDLVDNIMDDIINPIENYETRRHKFYGHYINYGGFDVLQHDIFYFFHFLDYDDTYTLEYSPIGLTLNENSMMLKEVETSFFKLEFYKTKDDDTPTRNNRKLVMTKNLSIPLGEKYFYDDLNDHIFRPVFTGNTFRNSENMFLYYYEDETNVLPTEFQGGKLWMTLKFYNSDSGEILDFVNKDTQTPKEEDLYYQVHLVNDEYHVKIDDTHYGTSDNPIKFYQKR